MEKFLRIGVFSKMVGISSSSLRDYEKEGIIIPHHKSPKGQRVYTQEQADAVLAGDFNNPVLKGIKGVQS